MLHSKLITGMLASLTATVANPQPEGRKLKAAKPKAKVLNDSSRGKRRADAHRQMRRDLTKAVGHRQAKRMIYLDRHPGYAAKHPVMAKQLGYGHAEAAAR